MSVCPKSFSCNNVLDETEELAISIDDDGQDEEIKMEDSIFNKTNQFIEDIKNLSLEGETKSENKDEIIKIDDKIKETNT